jgi:7,8-dihydropterin-6-yl-methyl-4-(beta-D-ribofuranosyl)aminobenzene 5'-phosphate synthase
MVQATRDAAGPVHTVLGGFHMRGQAEAEIRRTTDGLNSLGVRRVGPCHCSGDETRRVMQEMMGDGFLSLGVGAQWQA